MQFPETGMHSVDAAGLPIGGDAPPRIMGVLNVSEESPYDPSVYSDPGEAAAYVDKELIGEGAEIVDIGLESANKRLDVLSAEQELDRLETAIQTIESTSGDAIFSLETRYAEVAKEALNRGFDMINDICGFADPDMPEVCAAHDVAVSKMASPPDLTRPGAIDDTDWETKQSEEWLEDSDYVDRLFAALEQNGFTEKTIVDPAFGGWSERKTVEHDRKTFRRLREFRAFGRPILVSINRKNFLRSVADRSTEEALPVSLAATAMAVERGADVIRTHDVAETRDAALIGHEFGVGERAVADEVTVREIDGITTAEARRRLASIGGEPELAGELGATTLAITGADAEQRAVIADAASDVGAVVSGDQTLLVGGTAAALDALASTVGEQDGDDLSAAIRTPLQ